MSKVPESGSPVVQTKRPKINLTKIIIAAIAGILIFNLGVNVGRGALPFSRDSVFSKSVSKKLPNNLDYSSVEDVYDKLRAGYDGELDQAKLMDGLKQGLASASGDPYTEYFNPSEAKDFNGELSGTFSGIGAELSKDANGNIIVISPIAGFPAEKAGLKPRDIIASVDGKSLSGASVNDAVTKIRGPIDTEVTLQVVRSNEQLEFKIKREQIKVPSVKYEITPDNVGYLQISRFGDDTAELAQEAAEKFVAAGVRGVVLDLRGDPGGLLDAAVDVSSLWLDPSQVVLQEKRGGEVIRTYKANGTAPLKGKKTIVLINEGSASASEITAGALRDNKAATLMGSKSFGKGSVQQVLNLAGGSLIKITIAHWYTPSGAGIDKKGLEPEKKVDRSDDDIKNNRDPQKDAAFVEILK